MRYVINRSHYVLKIHIISENQLLSIYCGHHFEIHMLSISKGDYVIVDPIEEGEKVKAEISFILYKDHIQYLQKQQHW